MPTLFMLRGLPASGKTTIARKMVDGGCKRVNRDDLRMMIDNGRYSPEQEKLIKAARDAIIKTAILAGFDVVVDDTNLRPADETDLRFIAISSSADFKVVSVDTPLEECIRRDKERKYKVGEQVIRDMHARYLSNPDPDSFSYFCVVCNETVHAPSYKKIRMISGEHASGWACARHTQKEIDAARERLEVERVK